MEFCGIQLIRAIKQAWYNFNFKFFNLITLDAEPSRLRTRKGIWVAKCHWVTFPAEKQQEVIV